MPKKAPKNSFYFYMLDFKELQRKKGINYGNLAEVAEAASPSWQSAPPSVRAKFEEIAKKEKHKRNIPDMKFTSTGIPFAEVERQQKEERDAEDTEIQDIKNIVKLKSFNKAIFHEDFYLIDVNCYCKAGNQYIIGESTVLRFNLEDGIKDQYHEVINPGKAPVGYSYDMKLGCTELGLEMPDSEKQTNYFQVLANLIDYLKQQDPNAKTMPPLFTMPEKILPVQDFILQMCTRAEEDESIFRVYKLDLLFYTMINAIKSRSNEGFPKESLALAQLVKDPFKYSPGLSCEMHENTDKDIECTTSRTKRWAFTVLDSCCPVVGLDMRAGTHVPGDYDVDGILNYKEQKKERSMPSVAGVYSSGSTNTSLFSDSFNDTASGIEHSRKQPRKHEPVRMPKTSYTRNRLAPELTDTEFPPLTSGVGRGRGLSSSFGKMNMNK